MSTSRKPSTPTISESSLPDVPGEAAALVAERVAAARRRAGLTLTALALHTGLSPAYLSQIESATANPTVRALAQIAAALGSDVVALFGVDAADPAAFAPYYSPAARAAAVAGLPGIWDRTAPGSRRLTARLVHGDTGDHARPVAHAGEEFVVVLQGRCTLHVDGVVRTLGPGDACHYDAAQPHHISAPSTDLTLSVVMSEGSTAP